MTTLTTGQAGRIETDPRTDADRVFALREVVARAAEAFTRARADQTRPVWDAIVLTAANERQAAAYRRELTLRRDLGLLPNGTDLFVIADPEGVRVGSGGATLLALETLARHLVLEGEASLVSFPFARRRVLLVHSGGDSQRMPAFGAIGKIFTPLPFAIPRSPTSTIFDWLYILASGLPRVAGEVVVASGDVILLFDPTRVPIRRSDVCGVGIRVPAEVGARHGVYAIDTDGRLRRFLHKQSADSLAEAGALDAAGEVLIDSGITVLGHGAVERLLGLAGLRIDRASVERTGDGLLPRDGGARPFDLYNDFMAALGRGTTAAEYGVSEQPVGIPSAEADESTASARDLAWVATRELTAEVAAPEVGEFIHLGTHLEYHRAIATHSLLRAAFPVAAVRDSRLAEGVATGGALICRSSIGPAAQLGSGVVLEHCRVDGELVVGESSLVSGVEVLSGCSLRVPAGSLCYQTIVRRDRSERVNVLLGLRDNPKARLGDADASFRGESWERWLSARGLAPADVWPAGAAQSLWEAGLFVATDADPNFALLEWLGDAAPTCAEANGRRARWLAAERYSLRRLHAEADCLSLLDWRERLIEQIAVGRVLDDVARCGDEDFADLFVGLPAESRQRVTVRLAEAAVTLDEPLKRARLNQLLASFGGRRDPALDDRAIEAVREAIVGGRDATPRQAELRVPVGRIVRVQTPVRVDFGGGWTDTPPFSLERGGAVVNAALMLDGELPIEASVEVLAEPRLIVESGDLGYGTEIRDGSELSSLGNVLDPFLLPKASLVLSGLLRAEAGPIARQLERIGGGLRVRTACRLPRGSGLGTSSILGAALLKALDEAKGEAPDDATLSGQTLALEQLMTTGGGWQDQMGAIVPALKLITTEPGVDQTPTVREIRLSDARRAELEAHLVVAYTGHHRVAKNILREVVLRYLARDPLAMQALYGLKALAHQLTGAFERFDLELVGTLMNQAWLLNKTLDPQTSYPALERLFRALAPHVHGVKLVGAGGGGFLMAIGKTPEARDLLAEMLATDREFGQGYVTSTRCYP